MTDEGDTGDAFNPDEVEDHLERALGISPKDFAGKHSLLSMSDYTTSKSLNSIRRTGKMLTGNLKTIDVQLQRLAKPIGLNAVVHRAVDNAPRAFGLVAHRKLEVGDGGDDSGWMSTSISPTAAEKHLTSMLSPSWRGEPPRSPALLRIVLPKTQRAVWVGPVSRFAWQRELLLVPNTTLRILRVIERRELPPVIVCEAR